MLLKCWFYWICMCAIVCAEFYWRDVPESQSLECSAWHRPWNGSGFQTDSCFNIRCISLWNYLCSKNWCLCVARQGCHGGFRDGTEDPEPSAELQVSCMALEGSSGLHWAVRASKGLEILFCMWLEMCVSMCVHNPVWYYPQNPITQQQFWVLDQLPTTGKGNKVLYCSLQHWSTDSIVFQCQEG